MSSNFTMVRIEDIGILGGSDWEITLDVDRIGVSYISRHNDSVLQFTDEQKNVRTLNFENNAIITFRGSILIYDTTNAQPRTTETG